MAGGRVVHRLAVIGPRRAKAESIARARCRLSLSWRSFVWCLFTGRRLPAARVSRPRSRRRAALRVPGRPGARRQRRQNERVRERGGWLAASVA